MRICKYETLQEWVNIFEQKNLLNPERQKRLMDKLSWAVQIDVPGWGDYSNFSKVLCFRTNYLTLAKNAQKIAKTIKLHYLSK
jgi:hypothetical protein